MTRLMILAALAFTTTLVAACSNAEPTPTPVDAHTVIDRVIEAMTGVSYVTETYTEWRVLNRATGEWRDGGESHTTAWAEDGSFRQVITFPNGAVPSDLVPERMEIRCAGGEMYLWHEHESSGWATPQAESAGCPFTPELLRQNQLDVDWTSGPGRTTTEDGAPTLRLEGELLIPDERDGQPDPSAFVLKTVRLDVEPETFRIVELDVSTESYVGEDSWGIVENVRAPISIYTTVTRYSKYGEPVVVEVPEVLE